MYHHSSPSSASTTLATHRDTVCFYVLPKLTTTVPVRTPFYLCTPTRYYLCVHLPLHATCMTTVPLDSLLFSFLVSSFDTRLFIGIDQIRCAICRQIQCVVSTCCTRCTRYNFTTLVSATIATKQRHDFCI